MRKKISSIHLIVFVISMSAILVLVLIWTTSSLASPTQAPEAPLAPQPIPKMINYQGTVRKNGTIFDGTGYFKFAIMDSPTGNGTTNYWAHDGTAAYTPTTYITLTVTNGLFNVLLGDTSITSMTKNITETVFNATNTYLRVWFSDTPSNFQGLEPNQSFASVAYALRCQYADDFNETDPIFSGSPAFGISSPDIVHWNNAYGWGDHSLAGYDTTDDSWKFSTISPSDVYMQTGNVGIGVDPPSTLLDVHDGGGSNIQLTISQSGFGGNSAIDFFDINLGQDYSLGLEYSDGNFKITNRNDLTGGSGSNHGDGYTILESKPSGDLSFPNQIRARAYLTHTQLIPPGGWIPVEFDNDSILPGGYDQQGNFFPSTGPGIAGQFIAFTEGYFQVHARTVFTPTQEIDPIIPMGGYVSIAIFVTDATGLQSMYAQGNNLQMFTGGSWEEWSYLIYNNAPNVSDVIHLNSGDIVEIHVFQNFSGIPVPLGVGRSQTYVAIHKDS
jgi:hypothetical protein